MEEVSVEQQEEKDGVGAFEGAPKSRDGIARRVLRVAQARLGVLVLVFAFVATAGVTSWLYAFQYRADHQTDADAAKAACTAASDGTVAILSYTPETLEKDFGAAKLRLTGNFLDYYTRFTEQIVTPAAKQKSVKNQGDDRAGRHSRDTPGCCGGACVRQPDDHEQGESRRSVHRKQCQGGIDESRRHLADLLL